MSIDLDDIIDLKTVSDILGIRLDSARMLMNRGRLGPVRFIGPKHRGIWLVTRAGVARYQAEKDYHFRGRGKS